MPLILDSPQERGPSAESFEIALSKVASEREALEKVLTAMKRDVHAYLRVVEKLDDDPASLSAARQATERFIIKHIQNIPDHRSPLEGVMELVKQTHQNCDHLQEQALRYQEEEMGLREEHDQLEESLVKLKTQCTNLKGRADKLQCHTQEAEAHSQAMLENLDQEKLGLQEMHEENQARETMADQDILKADGQWAQRLSQEIQTSLQEFALNRHQMEPIQLPNVRESGYKPEEVMELAFQQVNATAAEIQKLQSELISLTQSDLVQQLRTQNDKDREAFNQKMETLDGEVLRLREELNPLITENQNVAKKLELAEKTLAAHKEKLATGLQELDERVQAVKEEITQLEEQNEMLSSNKASRNKECAELELEIQRLKGELARSDKAATAKEAQIQEYEASYQKERAKQIADFEKEMQSLSTVLQELEDDDGLADQEAELAALEKSVQELESQLSDLQGQLSGKMEALRKLRADSRQNQEALNDLLCQNELKQKELSEVTTQCEVQKVESQRELEVSIMQIHRIEVDISKLRNAHQKMEAEQALKQEHLQEQLKDAIRNEEGLTAKIAKLRERIEGFEKEIESPMKDRDLEALSAERDRLKQSIILQEGLRNTVVEKFKGTRAELTMALEEYQMWRRGHEEDTSESIERYDREIGNLHNFLKISEAKHEELLQSKNKLLQSLRGDQSDSLNSSTT